MSVEHGAKRLSLNAAQRRVIDDDDMGWIGWDSAGLPVLSDQLGTYSIAKTGKPVAVVYPIEAP